MNPEAAAALSLPPPRVGRTFPATTYCTGKHAGRPLLSQKITLSGTAVPKAVAAAPFSQYVSSNLPSALHRIASHRIAPHRTAPHRIASHRTDGSELTFAPA